MAEQSKLEKIGIETRDKLQAKNDYYKDVANGVDEEYSEAHKDAKSDGDKLGKGAGLSIGYSVPGQSSSKAINYSNLVTDANASPTGSIGGLYDIEGYGALEGKSGRQFMESINLYNSNNRYGESSVDTSANVADGQKVMVVR